MEVTSNVKHNIHYTLHCGSGRKSPNSLSKMGKFNLPIQEQHSLPRAKCNLRCLPAPILPQFPAERINCIVQTRTLALHHSVMCFNPVGHGRTMLGSTMRPASMFCTRTSSDTFETGQPLLTVIPKYFTFNGL